MPRLRPATVSYAVLSALILSTVCFAAAPDRITGPIVAAQRIKLAGGVSLKARPEFDQGAVDPSFNLSYITLLTAPSAAQQRALDKLFNDQQDPRSPSYHKWLTPEQYGSRFGLSQNDLNKITAWLQSQGFTIVRTARGRNWIVFSGSAAQVERTFQTQIHNFQVDGEIHFANTAPPAIPAALSGIVTGFRGLNNFRPKSQSHQANPDYTLTLSGNNFYFLAPGDIATIYDVSTLYGNGIDGTGQKLAVMGQTDVFQADLADFRSGFGLSPINCTVNPSNVITACNTANFQYILIGSDPGSPHPGDLGEADLDIEWSGATARNAQIIYVNAPATANGVWDSWYYAVDNSVAPVINLSYTAPCELAEATFGTSGVGTFASDEAELQKANMEGITFLNSSGDTGAAECDFGANLALNGYAVAYPASSQYVTGVGGTMIPLVSPDEYTPTFWNPTNDPTGGSATGYIPEQVWNDSQEFGAFCAANPSNQFCTGNHITNWASAQSVIGLSAGGGGLSNCVNETGGVCATPPNGGFPQPSWQSALVVPGETGAAVRFTPDVSLLASPNFPGYIICTPHGEVGGTGSTSTCSSGIVSMLTACVNGTRGACSIFGGTSVSSPVFAGMVTLLNQYFQGSASNGLGNINPMLYSLAATPANGAFNPVTTGSIGVFCSPGTPAGQPPALQCPGGGFLGFDASNFDPTTHYNLAVGLGSVDLNKLALAWAAVRPATSVTVQASSNQSILGLPITLTATVSGSSPTGFVSFFNNGSNTALGTATLSSGVATLNTTALPVGTDNITASYAGDGYNAPSTTITPAVVTVIAPTFTLAANPPAQSHIVLAGQSTLTYTFVATPTTSGQTTFTFPVTFACSFAPTDPTLTNASCGFTPTSIPAGAGTTNVTVTITSAGPNTGTGGQIHHRADSRMRWLPLSLPLAGIVVAGIAGRKLSKYSVVASLCLALVLLGVLMACGGSSAAPISVSVTGTPSSLFPNNAADGWPSQTAQFTATVSNDSTNKGVTWSVAGSPTNGTIDANGLYTAPTIAAGLPARVTITATSVTDSSKSGSASETLKPATVPGAYTATVTASEANATAQAAQVSLTVQ